MYKRKDKKLHDNVALWKGGKLSRHIGTVCENRLQSDPPRMHQKTHSYMAGLLSRSIPCLRRLVESNRCNLTS